MIGAHGGPYFRKGTTQVSIGYRWQRSDRHFVGSQEQPQRQAEGSQVINNINLVDFNATYAFSERFSLGASVPIIFTSRQQTLRDQDRNIVSRYATHSSGISDMSVVGRYWIGAPEEHPDQNVSFGLGIKLPTGNSDAVDAFPTFLGPPVVHSVDQSIQPGDGGVGMVLELQGFKQVLDRATMYGSFVYLVNPRETNGTDTARGRPSESIMSVPDEYLGSLGVLAPLKLNWGLAGGLGLRIEGVPARDLIGGSLGFRRPGYAVSLQPTVVWTHGANTLNISVPVALYRNRTVSVSDLQDGRHGDAAFADYFVLVGLSRRFD